MAENDIATKTANDEGDMDADFGAGFSGSEVKAKKSPDPGSDKPTERPREQADEDPDVVKITRKDWEEVQAAARRTATYEHQFSKLHGTTGKIQQVLNELRSQTPRDLKVDLPAEAFTKMAKDFPELAELSREEFQTALAGLKAAGNAKPDAEAIQAAVVELELKDLADEYPDWKDIVGAVADQSQADPDNAFRKWLASKDKAYQDRINATSRASVIQRSIDLFKSESRTPPKVTPRNDARADRIKAAVQPRGDNAGTPPGNSEEEAFAEGYRSR